MQQRLLLHHVPKLRTCCHVLRHPNEANTDVQHRGRWAGAEPEIQRQKEPFLLALSGQGARREAQIWQPFVQLLHQSRAWKTSGREARSRSHCRDSASSTLCFPWFLSAAAEPSRLWFRVAFPPFCLPALAVQRLLAVFLHDFWDGCRLLWLLLSRTGYFLTERCQVQAEPTEVS